MTDAAMKSLVHDTPVGKLTLASDGHVLTQLDFDIPRYPSPPVPRGSDKILDAARKELDAYFAGRLRRFETPVRGRGTPFQRKVWAALMNIPYGVTKSYGQLAAEIGAPNASRAVGLANGRNPISIIVPCHRVIGANGSLTGYGGGMERKRFLLDLEQGPALIRC